MQIAVSGKQLSVGEAFRKHAETRLTEAVDKYFEHAIESHVVVSREAHSLRADISVHVGRGILVQGHGLAGEAHAAFDMALERIAKRLRRYKRRLRDHHRKKKEETREDTLRANQYVLASTEASEDDDGEGTEDQPVVIAETMTEIDRLTVGEAVMRLDLEDAPAIMFRNSVHGGVNVLYRRPDGNIGWIDPKADTTDKG